MIKDLYNNGKTFLPNIGESLEVNLKEKSIFSWTDIVDYKMYRTSHIDGFDFSISKAIEPFGYMACLSNNTNAQVYGSLGFAFLLPNIRDIRISWWETNSLESVKDASFDKKIIARVGTDSTPKVLYKIDIGTIKKSLYENVVNSIKTSGTYNVDVAKSSDYQIEAYTSASCVVDDYKKFNGDVFLHFVLDIKGLKNAPCIYMQIWGESKGHISPNAYYKAGGFVFSDKEINTSLLLPMSKIDNSVFPKISYNHNADNLIADQFDGCAFMYQMEANFSAINVNRKSVQSVIRTDYAIKKKSKTIDGMTFEGYCIHAADGSQLPFYKSSSELGKIIEIASPHYVSDSCRYEPEKEYYFQFWADLEELNGNGLSRIYQYGYLRYNIGVANKGDEWRIVPTADAADFETKEVALKVVERIGNMVCLQMPLVEKYNASICILGSLVNSYTFGSFSGNPVYEITLYNPTLVTTSNIDPFYKYLSKSQKIASKWRGKNVMYIGDSEYNNGILGNMLARELGANVYDMHFGGHRLSIGPNYSTATSVSSISHSWFYQETYRKLVLSQPIDAMILTFSSNDASGDADWNGTIDENKIAAVEANYPTLADMLNDDRTSYNSKMTLFNALSNAQKNDVFGFVGTYCAYIKQILEANPRCKVYLCSVPISCSGFLSKSAVPDPSDVSEEIGQWASGKSPDEARTYFEEGFLNKDSQIRAVAKRYHAKFVDIRNSCGMTYENFIYHCTDGVHWHKDVAYNCAIEIIKEM